MSQPNGESPAEILEEVLVRTVDLDSLFDSLGTRPGETAFAGDAPGLMTFGPADGIEDVLEALKSHIHADES